MRKTLIRRWNDMALRRRSQTRAGWRPRVWSTVTQATELLERRTFFAADLGAASSPIVLAADTLPDLVVDDVNGPSAGSVGGTILVAWTVRNNSTVTTASRSISDGIYFSLDNVLDGGDTFLKYVSARSRTPLPGGATYTATDDVRIPNGTVTGTYYLIVQADDLANAEPESNESNNWAASPGTVTVGAPDLAFQAVTYPATAFPGTNLTFEYTVKNQSLAYDAFEDWFDRAVLSVDDVYGNADDVFLGEWDTTSLPTDPSPLAPGGTYTVNQTLTVPPEAAGNRYLLIKTDAFEAQDETDEANNVLVNPIRTLPELAINDVMVAEGDAGTSNATFTVTLEAGAAQIVTVNWATANGTALAGSDFASASGTLTFNIGETTHTLVVPINGDTLDENSETFFVNLSGATNAVATDSQGLGTILDNDSTPVATNDAYSVDSGTMLEVAAAGVLSNDTDADGGPLTSALDSGPTYGSLTFNSNGSFTYTPTGAYVGPDSFTYRASDGPNSSNVATVAITVNAVNHAPVAANDAFGVNEDGTINVPAPGVLAGDTDSDGNPLTAVLETGPSQGSLTLNSDGSFSYAPAANFHGTDSFTYKASDGLLTSNIATVTITVSSVNDGPPVSLADSYSTNEDTALNVAAPGVLANDTDVDGDVLTAELVTEPAHGGLTMSANGSFSYIPASNYNGPDSFAYRANDGTVSGNTVTVSITVNPVNDAPAAVYSEVAPGGPTGGGAYHWFKVSYSDVDGSVAFGTIGNGDVQVTGPGGYSQLGTLSNLTSASGTWTATYRIPAPGGSWNAPDNGTYTVSMRAGEVFDNSGASAVAGTLATFNVLIGDLTPPTATLIATNISTPVTYHWFQVRYTDDVAVKFSTINGTDVQVTGPGGYSSLGTLSNLTHSSGTWTATYRITAPGGTWDSADNGTYTVLMRASEVADNSGKFAPPGTLGTFSALFSDSTPPTAALTASDLTTGGGTYYWFRVAYADNAGVAFNTIDGNDVEVTGPNGYVQPGVVANLTSSAGTWTATYRVTAPGGTWGTEDNGTYTVTLKPSQVADTSGNFAVAGSLGPFQVSVPAPPAPAGIASTGASNVFSDIAIVIGRARPASRLDYSADDLLR